MLRIQCLLGVCSSEHIVDGRGFFPSPAVLQLREKKWQKWNDDASAASPEGVREQKLMVHHSDELVCRCWRPRLQCWRSTCSASQWTRPANYPPALIAVSGGGSSGVATIYCVFVLCLSAVLQGGFLASQWVQLAHFTTGEKNKSAAWLFHFCIRDVADYLNQIVESIENLNRVVSVQVHRVNLYTYKKFILKNDPELINNLIVYTTIPDATLRNWVF